MVHNRNPDCRRGLDQPEHLSGQHMVPVRGQSRLGRAGHHVEKMEPVDRADCDHYNISTPSGPEYFMTVAHAQAPAAMIEDQAKSWYCPLPFRAVFVDSTGISPCCMIPREPVDLVAYPTPAVKGIQEDFIKGAIPTACKVCHTNERSFGRSIRTEAVKDYQSKIYHDFDIDNIDFRSSNICNFRCRSCNTAFSHGIHQEVIATPSLSRFLGPPRPSKIVSIDENNKQYILNNLHKIRRFMFTGGEPTVIPEVRTILEKILHRGHPDVQILITSNCSFTDDFWYEFTLKTSNLHWTASIDAVSTDAEFIRDGTKWAVVEKNVRWLATHASSLDINTVVSNLNILKLKPLLHLASELQQLSRHPHGQHGDLGCRHQFIVAFEPRLSALNWPDDLRPKVIAYLQECLDMPLDSEQIQTIKQLIKEIGARPFNQEDWQQALECNKMLDLSRDQKYSDIMFEAAG